MYKTIKYTVITLFTLSLILPVTSFGATATSTRSYSNSRFYTEGPTESGRTRSRNISEYRRRSSELQKKIDELPDEIDKMVAMPVLFGVTLKNISPNFGDPRSGGRTHEGEDIMAVKGTPIVSPTEAVVIRTGIGSTEGNYVYTANPGGEVFVYMHLDRIGEGVESGSLLEKGELIGYVGNTGNASGGAAHLHFEIHDDSGDPIDPYPRLKEEIDLEDKIEYLENILQVADDEEELAELLVLNFRSTFTLAVAEGIDLPSEISDAMKSVPASVSSSTGVVLPAGDMDIGSSGIAVIDLQKYLIEANVGPSARQLANAGATGYFGVVTKAALLEFQKDKDISPANGYYGTDTRKYITQHPFGATLPKPTTPNTPTKGLSLSRDLTLGVTGDDVRALQVWLNSNGYMIASSGSGSKGFETTYFGPATQAAVIRFQIDKGITPTQGYVGSKTRSVLLAL